MFERFDDSAREVLLLAKHSADAHSESHIGTGHLLLGIVNTAGIGHARAAADVIAVLGVTDEAIRFRVVPVLGSRAISGPRPGHLPFTPDVKAALEHAVRAADVIGSNHVGAEHVLAGLAGNPASTAGKVLAMMGITDTAVLGTITDTAVAASPTGARTTIVYLPVGKSVFKNGGRIYPDLATAVAAHPDQEVAPFPLALADGEYFTLILGHNAHKPVASFAAYADAYAAAETFRETQGVTPGIRIMAPDVTEHRGQDAAGRDVVLGRTVKYGQVTVMSRVVAPTLHPTKTGE